MEPPAKRQRRTSGDEPPALAVARSLSRAISPPPSTPRARQEVQQPQQQHAVQSSPWQLTWIRDLPAGLNRDAVTLKDILGDPLITEAWIFNFLHDLAFIMEALDPDTRALVKLHLVHGFWRREDSSRLMIEV